MMQIEHRQEPNAASRVPFAYMIAAMVPLLLLTGCHGSHAWNSHTDSRLHFTSDPPEAYPDQGGVTNAGPPVHSHEW
ncbi:MAG: hypothetical protein D8M59_14050 [Planctomycetes bacterium]|nr:hypothetical protein [Planctomycetota bacterium]NOG55631.1 hypothetical protein [Planctomycetota bacterium]